MEAKPDARPAGEQRFCSSCGHAIPGAARFCPDCGAAAPSGTVTTLPTSRLADGFAMASPKQPSRGLPTWVPWVVAALVFLLGVGGFVQQSSKAKAARTLASSRLDQIGTLNDQISQLRGNLESANSQIASLDGTNTSLSNALRQCRDAAEQGEKAVNSVINTFTISYLLASQAVTDLKALKTALGECTVQANSNGVL